MKEVIKKFCIAPVLLAVLTAACSTATKNSDESNAGAPQNGVSSTPQSENAPAAQAPATQTATSQPQANPPGNIVKAEGQVATVRPAAQPDAKSASKGPAPRLIVPVKKLDFGKQPKQKTLVRTFTIKNAGNAKLEIKSVEPS